MKKSVPLTVALFCALNLLISCSLSKNAVDVQNSYVENVKETTRSCYVQLNDGSIQHFNTLKLVTGVMINPHLLANGKVVIQAKDILAYENDKHYAVSNRLLSTDKISSVSVETLPGFAIQVVNGKLNVYARKFYNGVYSIEEYFLQAGNDGEIIEYSTVLLNNLIKDNSKALEFFKKKTKNTDKTRKLLAVANIYNNDQLITKN